MQSKIKISSTEYFVSNIFLIKRWYFESGQSYIEFHCVNRDELTPPKKCDNQFRLAIVLIIIRIRQTSVPYFHFHCVSMLSPVAAINQPFHFPHKVNNAMEEVRVLINNNSLHLHHCCFFAWCNSPKFLTVALSSMKSNNPPETGLQ